MAVEPIFLKKSKQFYKIYGGLFLFSLFCSIVLRPILGPNGLLIDLLVGLPIFAMIGMAPVGLIYSWKSYKRKEGRSITRFKYFVGHLFFVILVLLFIVTMIKDFSQII